MKRCKSKSKKLSNSNENFKKYVKTSHPEKFYSLSKDIINKKD